LAYCRHAYGPKPKVCAPLKILDKDLGQEGWSQKQVEELERGSNMTNWRYRYMVLVALFFFGVPSLDAQAQTNTRPVKLGITTVLVERELYLQTEMVNYVGQKIGEPIELVQKRSFQASLDMLEKGEIDAAFVCGSLYTLGREEFGAEILVVPQMYAEGPIYYAYLIVPVDSPARSLKDLKGQRFAFVDPLSVTGRLVTLIDLMKMGERPENFFKAPLFTHSHSASIEAVADKFVDGASVMSTVWDSLTVLDPSLLSRVKVIQKSESLPMTPIVVRAGLDPSLKLRLRSAFLKMDEDPVGAGILKKMNILKFVMVPDSHYDSIRALQRYASNYLQRRSVPAKTMTKK
jgi:phosphonate transport system substrate-binding protein